ncbi:MAG: DUF6934 family protein [Saprospiraceae bacterium]
MFWEKIPKLVTFEQYGENKWNVGFGDFKRGIADDSAISNNGDVARVLNTVAQIIREFFMEHPDAIVEIKPIDEKRKRLYNLIFQRHFEEIASDFQIKGLREGALEEYSLNKFYDGFEISLIFET